MKWKVTYECGFDEGDGDYCKESGTLDHPTNGSEWVVDDTSKDDMKLLALFDHTLYEEFGGDESKDYGDVDDDTIKEKLKNDEFLKKIGVTEEEIDKFMEDYSIYDYFPSNHGSNDIRHDHWFDIKLEPAETKPRSVDDDFCYGPWAKEQQQG